MASGVNTLQWLLAAIATSDDQRSTVLRCDPSTDDRTPVDLTGVCRRCGRRLTMNDIGGGPMDGPTKPLPVCSGGNRG